MKPPFNKTKDDEKMSIDLAEKTLENIFKACNQAPNSTPISLIIAKQKSQNHYIRAIRTISIIALILLVLSPIAFIKPHYELSIDLTPENEAILSIETNTLFKPIGIQATINEKELPLKQLSDSLYVTTINENGTLLVTITAINYQQNIKQGYILNIK